MVAGISGEEELAEQAGPLLCPLAHSFCSQLHGCQFSLDEQVHVSQVSAGVVGREHTGQRLKVRRAA